MANFSTWTHPASGQTRVYINGLAGQDHGTKIWFEQQPVDAFGGTINLRASSRSRTRGEIGNLQNDAYDHLTKVAGHRVFDWAELLALVAA